jgi:hypothetical protein
MADVKISGLPASTTPLAGTEVLPVVQGGVTKKVAVSDLTAGRAVSAASLALTTTPLPVASGGTGLATLASNRIPYGNGTGALASSSGFTYDGNNFTTTGSAAGGFIAGTIANSDGTGYSLLQLAVAANTAQMYYIPGFLMVLKTPDASGISFNTNSSEKMRVHSSGGVSIGNTTDPGATNLSVTGSISSGSRAITKASMPVGSVIQTIYNSYSGNELITSATYVATSAYFLSITPSSSNSKVNIFVTLPFINGLGTGTITIYRNNTTNIDPFSGGLAGSITSGWGGTVSFMIQDSPATTSATSYTIYMKTSAGTVQIRPDIGFGCGTIMLQEIAV